MKRPQKWDKIDKALVSLKENHLFRTMKTIESAQSSHVTIDGKDYVLMAPIEAPFLIIVRAND